MKYLTEKGTGLGVYAKIFFLNKRFKSLTFCNTASQSWPQTHSYQGTW